MRREKVRTALISIISVPYLILVQVAYVITWGLETCIAWVGNTTGGSGRKSGESDKKTRTDDAGDGYENR